MIWEGFRVGWRTVQERDRARRRGWLDEGSDGDGAADCVDLCPDVDDAIFGPECAAKIPTVSAWGVVMLALLVTGGKIYFGRPVEL